MPMKNESKGRIPCKFGHLVITASYDFRRELAEPCGFLRTADRASVQLGRYTPSVLFVIRQLRADSLPRLVYQLFSTKHND